MSTNTGRFLTSYGMTGWIKIEYAGPIRSKESVCFDYKN